MSKPGSEDSVTKAKSRLRASLRKRRRELSQAEIASLSSALTDRVVPEGFWRDAKSVAAFVGCKGEPDTKALLHRALDEGKELWLPRVVSTGEMSFHRVDDLDQLQVGPWGILEPSADSMSLSKSAAGDEGKGTETPQLWLIPGLAFDQHGRRLGQGGGFYDRYFQYLLNGQAKYKSSKLVGLCFESFFNPVEGQIPTAEHDLSVHAVVTEESTYWAP